MRQEGSSQVLILFTQGRTINAVSQGCQATPGNHCLHHGCVLHCSVSYRHTQIILTDIYGLWNFLRKSLKYNFPQSFPVWGSYGGGKYIDLELSWNSSIGDQDNMYRDQIVYHGSFRDAQGAHYLCSGASKLILMLSQT